MKSASSGKLVECAAASPRHHPPPDHIFGEYGLKKLEAYERMYVDISLKSGERGVKFFNVLQKF